MSMTEKNSMCPALEVSERSLNSFPNPHSLNDNKVVRAVIYGILVIAQDPDTKTNVLPLKVFTRTS